MQFQIGFDRCRARQMALGMVPPLPTKCVEGYRIADFPHHPGFVMHVVPNFGESDRACALELAAVAAYASEHRSADGRCDAELVFFQAVSATSPFPTRILPPSEWANQGARS